MPVPDSSLEQDDLSEMKVNTEGVDETYVLTRDEIANLVHESGKPAETLMNVVALIAGRFQTDVCSAYLLEPDRAHLVLAATLGLRPQCIGTLRMGLHEGLAGLVAEQVRPVAVAQVKTHPRFKYFTEAGEDAYQSFLGVPLIDRGVLQGVLVVQTIEPRTFDPTEIATLADAAAQVAPVVSEARTLDRFIAPAQERLWALARNHLGSAPCRRAASAPGRVFLRGVRLA
jgi:glycogen phosphorylase